MRLRKYGYRLRKRKRKKYGATFVSRISAIMAYLNSLVINYTSENNIYICFITSQTRDRIYWSALPQVSFFPSPSSFAFFSSLHPFHSACRCIFYSSFFYRLERYKLLIVSKLAACWAALSFRRNPHTSIIFKSLISFVNEGLFS